MIDEAARNANRIPFYVTTSYQARDDMITTLRRQVRNGTGQVRASRIDVTELSGDNSRGRIYITRPDGAWMIFGKTATKLSAPSQLQRYIPRRLTTARLLGLGEPLEYSMENEFEYFGMPACKITVSLGSEAIKRLKEHPEILKKDVGKLAPTTVAPQTGRGELPAWLTVAESRYPVTFVYVIHRDVPFILSWAAYSFRGRKVYEVSTQEFQEVKALPDSLFTVPTRRSKQDPEQATVQPPRETFRFRGERRVEFMFGTPNRCAVVLAMAALIVAGWALHLWRRLSGEGALSPEAAANGLPVPGASSALEKDTNKTGVLGRKLWMQAGLGVLALVLVALFVLIALTYSRGGYLALAAGFLTLGLLARQWRFPLVCLLVFAACILAVPQGVDRVGTMGDISDGSIANRLTLWKGTLAMIADHGWTGTGLEGFRRAYASWYQPSWLHLSYGSAVNDYLSLAAYGGPFLLWAYLFVMSGLLFAGSRLSREGNPRLLPGLVAAVACYLVASIWSTFIIQRWVVGPLGLVVLSLLIAIVWARRNGVVVRWRGMLFWSAGVSTTSVVILAVAGGVVAHGYDYVPRTGQWARQTHERIDAAGPRHAESRGAVLFLFETWNTEQVAKEIMRPVASAGYDVVALQPVDSDLDGARQLETLLARIAKQYAPPYFVVAQGETGRIALAAEARGIEIAGLTLIGAQEWSPVEGLPSGGNRRAARPALLLVHGGGDRIVDVNESRKLYDKALAVGGTVRLHILPKADHLLRGHWPDVARTMTEFFGQMGTSRHSPATTTPQ